MLTVFASPVWYAKILTVHHTRLVVFCAAIFSQSRHSSAGIFRSFQEGQKGEGREQHVESVEDGVRRSSRWERSTNSISVGGEVLQEVQGECDKSEAQGRNETE